MKALEKCPVSVFQPVELLPLFLEWMSKFAEQVRQGVSIEGAAQIVLVSDRQQLHLIDSSCGGRPDTKKRVLGSAYRTR